MMFIVMLKEFRFQLCHIDSRRTLTLASFACQTQIENFVYLPAVPGIFALCAQHFTRYVCTGPGSETFITGGHITGTHRTPDYAAFTAVSRAVAFLGSPDN